MFPEDLDHLGLVRRAAGGGVNDGARFSEVGWPHNGRGHDRQLPRVLGTEIVKSVDGAAGNAYRLPGPDGYLLAVDRPSERTSDPIQRLFVGIVFVSWGRELLPSRYRDLEDRHAAVGILARQQKANAERPDSDGLFRWIYCRLFCHDALTGGKLHLPQ